MHDRTCDGPWSLVDGKIGAELGQIERRKLEREQRVDPAMAVVDGEADVDAGRHRRAYSHDPARGHAPVAGKITLYIGP